MHIAILGRQPSLGLAELERVFGSNSVSRLSPESAFFKADVFDIQKFGGITKAGLLVDELSERNWQKLSQQIISYFTNNFKDSKTKITLGLSAYNINLKPKDLQIIGFKIKNNLKRFNISLRLIPSSELSLNTATSHHNKLGLSSNKIEILIVKDNSGKIIVATSTGSQNITAYAARDQVRPNRDAFVGMLPPKLAQIMINLACGPLLSTNCDLRPTILDPFCGTGVILQEAALMNYSVYGTDLSEKMIRYSRDNLNWLADTHHIQTAWYLHAGDAMSTKWRQPISAVVCETYLGQPFSAPPSPAKLNEVVENCNHIITEFLRNLRGQIELGTPICLAIPAWRNKEGEFTHLPIVNTIARYGFKPHEFKNVSQNSMLYYRADQTVARELLVLQKT